MSIRVSAIIFQLFKVIMPEKCALLTILELNWNQRLGQDKIEHLSTQLQKKSFHIIERTRTFLKCQKMKNARAKRANILFFIVKYAHLWGFCCRRRRGCLRRTHCFCKPNMEPQFLSVVQFALDNCHSPFSPTTFFEIGVCALFYYVLVARVLTFSLSWQTGIFLLLSRSSYQRLCHRANPVARNCYRGSHCACCS